MAVDSLPDTVTTPQQETAIPGSAASGAQTTTLKVLTIMVNLNESINQPGSNVTGNDSEAVTSHIRSLPETIVLGVLLSVVVLMTICGNLLVIITIITNRRLRSPTNFFILALAITDLFLGVLVLPFSAVNTLAAKWPLGPIFCNIYNSFDVMLCTVSILTLFAISLDRYCAVNMPLMYQQRMNARIVWRTSLAIWTFSLIMAFVPIHLGWNTPSGRVQNFAQPDLCMFELNKPYALLVAVGTYFTPLFIMCAVYMKVLQITKHQVREINKLTRAGSCKTRTPRPDTETMLNGGHDTSGNHNAGNNHENSTVTDKHRHEKHKNLASDRKATVTLASVVLAFAICWVPYFALFTAKPFVNKPFNEHLDLFVLWLGYVNSTVNPFLYAFYNSAFRDGFKKVLCQNCFGGALKKHRYRPRKHRSGSSSETSELSVLRQTTNTAGW